MRTYDDDSNVESELGKKCRSIVLFKWREYLLLGFFSQPVTIENDNDVVGSVSLSRIAPHFEWIQRERENCTFLTHDSHFTAYI